MVAASRCMVIQSLSCLSASVAAGLPETWRDDANLLFCVRIQDAKTERLLSQAIERLTAGRTTIVVAHRLSTIQAADKIVMLEDGKAVEQGTHEELIAQPTRYRDLVSSQSLTLRR